MHLKGIRVNRHVGGRAGGRVWKRSLKVDREEFQGGPKCRREGREEEFRRGPRRWREDLEEEFKRAQKRS